MNRFVFYNEKYKKNTAHRIRNAMRNSTNIHLTKRREVWSISIEDFWVHQLGGVRGNFVKILWEFPQVFFVGMGWVWKLKSSSHGSPAYRMISDMSRPNMKPTRYR